MAALGLTIALVGTGPISGAARLTFGNEFLLEGFDFLPVAIGLFGIAEVLVSLENLSDRTNRSCPPRAIARRRAERVLIEEISFDTLQSLDKLFEVDPAIGQPRFHWLRSARDAPSASNLVGLTEGIAFLRKLENRFEIADADFLGPVGPDDPRRER